MNIRHLARPWHSLVAAAALFLVSGQVWAHGLEITGIAVCNEAGGLDIHYTATSHGAGAEGSNTHIDILVNGIVVDQGAFGPAEFFFQDVVPAPAGDSATLGAVAVDAWGDGFPGGQSAETTVVYPTDACVQLSLGRFTGGGSQVRIGAVRITRGLTLHCDLLLSNNLEINWGGDKFHTTEHLTTVACSDDPAIIQAPPPAPLDTMIGTGVGRYNNAYGYSIHFNIQDWGEPGTLDQMSILIFETANPANVILDVPLQVLTGGNLQAHFDQPHK